MPGFEEWESFYAGLSRVLVSSSPYDKMTRRAVRSFLRRRIPRNLDQACLPFRRTCMAEHGKLFLHRGTRLLIRSDLNLRSLLTSERVCVSRDLRIEQVVHQLRDRE